MTTYYNEWEPYPAQWLRNLIKADLIAPGDVDERSIKDVKTDDLKNYTQCHFFAGIGGWSYALRLAGWSDKRPVWTGSCPCQPFSNAGKKKGTADERHLWPEFKRLINECIPTTVFGEQVASATDWLRLVHGDLEEMGYSVGAMPIEAASSGADHIRDRFWFVADSEGDGWKQRKPDGVWSNQGISARQEYRVGDACGDVGNGLSSVRQRDARTFFGEEKKKRSENRSKYGNSFERSEYAGQSDYEWIKCFDEKFRRIKPGICLLADGVPQRVAKLRAFGNAIDPRPAQAFIEAFMEVRP